jgi:hypothetical protein
VLVAMPVIMLASALLLPAAVATAGLFIVGLYQTIGDLKGLYDEVSFNGWSLDAKRMLSEMLIGELAPGGGVNRLHPKTRAAFRPAGRRAVFQLTRQRREARDGFARTEFGASASDNFARTEFGAADGSFPRADGEDLLASLGLDDDALIARNLDNLRNDPLVQRGARPPPLPPPGQRAAIHQEQYFPGQAGGIACVLSGVVMRAMDRGVTLSPEQRLALANAGLRSGARGVNPAGAADLIRAAGFDIEVDLAVTRDLVNTDRFDKARALHSALRSTGKPVMVFRMQGEHSPGNHAIIVDAFDIRTGRIRIRDPADPRAATGEGGQGWQSARDVVLSMGGLLAF